MSYPTNVDPTYNRESPAIIAAAIAITWSIMVFFVRLYLRLGMKRTFGIDDVACTIGMALGVGSTSATLVSVRNGLGQHQSAMNVHQLQTYFQSTYAASLLYICAICASKCSTTLLVSRLKPGRTHSIAKHSVTCVTMAWGIASTLLIAFGCNLPRPWDTALEGHCSNLVAKWIVVEAFSCLVEVVLFGLAINILWDLQMPMKSKAIVLTIFSSRLLIIIPTVVRLHYMRHTLTSPDQTYDGGDAIIATQCVLHYSIMAATFPCLKPFLAAFDKELWHTTSKVHTPVGISFSRSRRPPDKGYVLHSVDKNTSGSSDRNFRSDGAGTQTSATPHVRVPHADARSTESDGSDVMIIRKTQEWHVTSEVQP